MAPGGGARGGGTIGTGGVTALDQAALVACCAHGDHLRWAAIVVFSYMM